MDLLDEIRLARRELPGSHRGLLDQLNVQEAAIDDWPQHVIDFYRTVKEEPPNGSELENAAAVWLQERRTVAFNAPLIEAALAGLDASTQRLLLQSVAWHEYGHALSLMRSTAEQRADGPRLLSLLTEGLRGAIRPDDYRPSQLFDEIIATLYALMVGRIREHGYGVPEFLHPDLFAAFQEVIPWPPTQ